MKTTCGTHFMLLRRMRMDRIGKQSLRKLRRIMLALRRPTTGISGSSTCTKYL
jgi:hypothetical protein